MCADPGKDPGAAPARQAPALGIAIAQFQFWRRFADLELCEDRVPDERTILKFRHLLENACAGRAAFRGRERAPEMHQTRKGKQWYSA